MKILRTTIAATLFFLVVVWCGNAIRAADSAAADELAILNVIPEDALAFGIVPHIDKFDEQAGKVAQEMQMPAPPPMLSALKEAGAQNGNGLDEHGAAAMVMLPGTEGSPPVGVRILAVSDYKEFIGQLQAEDASAEITKITIRGVSSLVGRKDRFAIFTETEHKELLKKFLDSSRPITPMIAGLAGSIGQHEFSVVATPTGVKYGAAAAQKGLAQIKAALVNANNETAKMAAGNLDAYGSLLTSAEKELSAVGVGVHVDNDGGLHVDSRALFVPNGAWATAGEGVEHLSGAKLACLPSGSYLLAFDGTTSTFNSLMNMSVGMINNMAKAGGGNELTKEQTKRLHSLMEKAMSDVRSMSAMMGEPKPGTSLYGNMSVVIKVKDSQRYLTDAQKMMEGMSEVMKQAGVDFPMPQDFKKLMIDDLDGVQVTMDMSKFLGMAVGNNAAVKQMMPVMFGPGGKLDVYMAPIDATTVAVSYVNTDGIARVRAACKNPRSSLAADADIAQTAKLLPEDAQWVGYLSLKGLMNFVNTMILAAAPPGAGGRIPALPPFPQTPPVGFAAEVSGKSLDLQIVVPGTALKAVGTYVEQMQQNFAPGAPPKFR